jgi:hypothetical protein
MMKDFALDYLTWVLAIVAISIVGGWIVHVADDRIERGMERDPGRYESGR